MRLLLCAAAICAVTSHTLVAQGNVGRSSIAGTVRDSATGESIPHARVTLADLSRVVETNADGRFVFVGVPPGAHVIRAHYIGYRPFEQRVASDSSGTLSVSLVRAAVQLDASRTVAATEQTVTAIVAPAVRQIVLSTAQVEAM